MKPGQIRPLYLEPRLHKQSVKQEINHHGTCLVITYKTTTKCLADNRTAKNEASVGPAENLPLRFDEFQNL
jgi:alpha-D-ribose 1-methylphosphonate 5-triphosphate synthase subunit PhnH